MSNNVRTGIILIGLAAAVLGFAVLFRPELASMFGISRPFVILIGAIAAILGFRSIQLRRYTERDQAEPADPETPHELPVPGDDFDETVATLAARRTGRWHGGDFDRIRSRLREVAIAVIRERERCSRTEAAERIDAGTWTDDPAARYFLGGPNVDRPPLSVRIRSFLGKDAGFQFYANRTADEITSLSPWAPDVGPTPEEDGDGASGDRPIWQPEYANADDASTTDQSEPSEAPTESEEAVESQ
ncbi:MAG: hypothetical protein SVG88_03315 [Halobacteriales archaeon]|nr:hypothetical protein [Halobacteriales archaeon]